MVAELFDKVRGYAKQHPLIASAIFIAVAPNIIFGLLFSVLGFIGWGRIFLLILIGLGYGAYKLIKSNVMVELTPFREEEDF